MNTPEGWYRDPATTGVGRYWDGDRWTERVQDTAGARATSPTLDWWPDPLEVDRFTRRPLIDTAGPRPSELVLSLIDIFIALVLSATALGIYVAVRVATDSETATDAWVAPVIGVAVVLGGMLIALPFLVAKDALLRLRAIERNTAR